MVLTDQQFKNQNLKEELQKWNFKLLSIGIPGSILGSRNLEPTLHFKLKYNLDRIKLLM